MSDVRLGATDLTVGYRRRAVLSNINVNLHAGELACLIGANGIGKSTLMRTLARAQPRLTGRIELRGRPITDLSPRELAGELAIVLTDRVAVGQLHGYDLVALGRAPHTGWFGRLDDTDRRVIEQALDTTNAGHLAHRPVSELSDGERQRLMIARALAQQPSVLLLDEPTAFLDVAARLELIKLLLSLTDEHGLAVLMSTHDVEHMLRHADSVWLVTPERELISGAPEEIGLAGHLRRMLNDAAAFDPRTGTFTWDTRHSATACITAPQDCSADLLSWTARAVERAGYRISEHHADITVEVRSPGRWLVGSHELDSVATLVAYLRNGR
ncbi:ABC transporter ATP-binding protein [Nonomuraea rubra]|uniref:Iron complex transport system ATP-binding protein n=1 Tax=Nonomuraea rubra TaxID=46180 RepID=A0A7X0P0X3_9ACTN|nr:ABC transporter ATP-binding protein [Nonomuraea rubra]MBB6553254.1 iron complex transport system ATP-binding protein [Nonomuraea rubra]